MEGWYVAKIKPQKETCLMSFLAEWEVEAFFPRIMEQTKSGLALKPLFPSYMFCRLDPQSSVWPVARWAPGMAYFLNHDGEPICVPDSMVEYLQERVGQWNGRDSGPSLTKGDQVVVLDGPFAGLEGVFQRYLAGRERCLILLETLGNLATIELPERDVRALSQGSASHQLGLALAR
ncbi:MAG: transcription termination/antitermination protein NusG [Dehalococcoidia bacterium]